MNKFKIAAISAALTVMSILGSQELAAQEDDEESTSTVELAAQENAGESANTVDTDAEDEASESTNTVDLAYIYVDNPNGKFGEYNGFDEDNHYIVLGLDWFLRNEDAPEQYGDVNIHNLGLATFSISGEYGKQGNYRIRGAYAQIQKVYHGDALTIYDNDLEDLPEPRDISTSVKRKTSSIGFDKFFGSRWELETDLRSQTKQGQRSRPTNGGLIVPQDVDFKHDEFEASLTYATEQVQLVFGSYFSDFSNDNDLILNTAAEPDNNFYKFSVNGGATVSDSSRITGYLAYSKGEQNDKFSRYGIDSGTYSTDSLNAEYDTINAQLSYRNRLTRKLDLDINYRLENRSNDTFLYSDFPSEKNNKVYEWDKQKLDVKVRYRLPARWRLLGGLQFADYQYEVNKSPRSTGRLPEQAAKLKDATDELTAWAEIRTPVIANFYGNLKYSHSDRDADLDPVREEAATVDTGGVALSFFLIPRVRDRIDLLLSYSFNENLSAGFNLSMIKDDYDPIAWASLDSRESNKYTFDISYSPGTGYSLNVYAGFENYEIEQSGFGTLGNDASRWEYESEDDSKLFGFAARASAFDGKIDFRLNYRHQQGSAQYETLDPSNVSGAFPDLETTISSFTLEANIFASRDFIINISYHYEDYDSDSWVWDNDFDEPGDTYFDVLNYGYNSPNYISQLFMVAASYRF
jgi:MtrB/PioB family decaheme-associated outer membrane protein